jgi:hypothetical protein
MIKHLAVCLLFLGLTNVAYGQEERAAASTTIGGKKVAIEYGRPALKGRSMADLLKKLPADRVWRAGAGAVTTLATEIDLSIGGQRVPAGKYSLYMYCPESGDFALVINSDPGIPLGEIFKQAPPERANQIYPHFSNYTGDIGDKEVARIPLRQIDAPQTESLTYSFRPAGKGALLSISWGTKAWTVELEASS